MEPVWMNRAVRGWTTLTAGKVLDLLAAALALQGLGDVIPFQAGCRPLELPRPDSGGFYSAQVFRQTESLWNIQRLS